MNLLPGQRAEMFSEQKKAKQSDRLSRKAFLCWLDYLSTSHIAVFAESREEFDSRNQPRSMRKNVEQEIV
jgi:hypothetical protein